MVRVGRKGSFQRQLIKKNDIGREKKNSKCAGESDTFEEGKSGVRQ